MSKSKAVPKKERELVTMADFARLKGVTIGAVKKAAESGRITSTIGPRGKRRIDLEIANVEWEKNSAIHKRAGAEAAAAKRVAAQVAPSPNFHTTKDAALSFNEAKTVSENYKSRMVRLEFEQLQGKLVDAEDVKAKWLAVAAVVRTKVLAVPAKARQLIAGMSSEQYSVLEKIVRETLEELSSEHSQ